MFKHASPHSLLWWSLKSPSCERHGNKPLEAELNVVQHNSDQNRLIRSSRACNDPANQEHFFWNLNEIAFGTYRTKTGCTDTAKQKLLPFVKLTCLHATKSGRKGRAILTALEPGLLTLTRPNLKGQHIKKGKTKEKLLWRTYQAIPCKGLIRAGRKEQHTGKFVRPNQRKRLIQG